MAYWANIKSARPSLPGGFDIRLAAGRIATAKPNPNPDHNPNHNQV